MKRNQTPLNETERNAIVMALHIAAQDYDRCMADALIASATDAKEARPAHKRLAEQFQQQGLDARRLAERIEQADEINVRESDQ